MLLSNLRAAYFHRLRFLAFLLCAMVVLGALLRVVLLLSFREGGSTIGGVLLALGAGVGFDVLCALAALTPLACLLALLRCAWLERPRVRGLLVGAFFAAIAFDAAAQYYFFEEFNARYNHVALDYLIYPKEVAGNVWESYNVPLVLGGALAIGVAGAFLATRMLRGSSFGPLRATQRFAAFGLALLIGAGAAATLAKLPEQVSSDRITSEMAQNGWVQIVRAFVTAELDYHAFYTTLPENEARLRAARRLGFEAPDAASLARDGASFSLERRIEPRGTSSTRPDVLVVLEESLGSNFVGVLGAKEPGLTPGIDRWSKDGVLLTNLVANGNRTVRGLEGVLCSFVPLPGDSVVKRPGAKNVATLARVFAAQGYATCFLYGGYGVFDRMKPFMMTNGWQEFVEQPDFPDGAFKTAWGVADEYIFDALLERQTQAREKGERLFATVMSVSNHRPYDVPPGRIDLPRSRQGAVKYSDWALARYLDQARERGVLEHTVVLVVGDHGARVYGAQEIPVASYRIPALFIAPDAQWPATVGRGQRIERLCSQIDLAPTLLSLAGLSCNVPFLGEDLLGRPDGPGRAFVHHNNDIGLLTDDALVVLQLNKRRTFYRRANRASDELLRVEHADITPELRELERDAAAVYQTAYELYSNGRYALEPEANVVKR